MILIKVTTVSDVVVDTYKAYKLQSIIHHAKHVSVSVTSRCFVEKSLMN